MGDPTALGNAMQTSATLQTNQLIAAHSRVGSFTDGVLTDDMLAAKRMRDSSSGSTTEWPDDPETFVDANFCQ